MWMPRSRGYASARLALTLLLIVSASGSGCSPGSPVSSPAAAPPLRPAARKFDFVPRARNDRPSSASAISIDFPMFTDVAAASGIQFVYDNGASPKSLMVESTGGGCGWFDFDRDGRLDLFLTQGGIPDISSEESRPPDACYRQLDGGLFIDVADLAGVGDTGYGQGVAIGDLDNDGFDDLFVANVGLSSLYLNQGDGTFRPARDRLAGKRQVWSSSAAWGDIDRDGDLDLYVCNYAIYDPYHPVPCRDSKGVDAICHPRNVEPEADEFFLNQGDGTFVEMSRQMGLFGPGNKALGVVIADLTEDGWPDIYVANDTTPNFLFVNEQGKHFKESAMFLGGAVSATGDPQASMGIAFGDFDRNGLPDICLSHFTGEGYTLYQNLGPQGVQDVTALTGLREPTLPKLGFGSVMSDFNLDSHMDLFFTNGHIDPKFSESEGYEMTPQQFSFDGVKWRDGSAIAGAIFSRRSVGRGVASADYDGDGDLDLIVVHQNSPAALLRNDSKPGHGLRVGAIGRLSNRNGFGAKVTVHYGDQSLVAELAGGTSFEASHQRLLFFGLGAWNGPCRVEVVWPSGALDAVELATPDQLVMVEEGRGRFAGGY